MSNKALKILKERLENHKRFDDDGLELIQLYTDEDDQKLITTTMAVLAYHIGESISALEPTAKESVELSRKVDGFLKHEALKGASQDLVEYIEKNVDGFSEEFIELINEVKHCLDND